MAFVSYALGSHCLVVKSRADLSEYLGGDWFQESHRYQHLQMLEFLI